uniref:Uncharacterized protein n=1 Tax=Caenorhabditis japonica TaxID=281687 RepID=A0A8R1DP92_CAEJA
MMETTGLRYAIAQYTFDEPLPTPDGIQKLELLIGDRICVYGQHGEWGFGRKFDEKVEKCGLFPLSFVQFVQKSMFVSTSDGYLVVDEISRVVNEWWTKMKDLLMTSTKIASFEDLMDSFNELLVIKQKIESGGIPIEELSKLRIRVSILVDRGNTLLGMDVVIRDDEGVPLDVESLSLLRTYEAHISSQRRVGNQLRDKTENTVAPNGSFSLLLSIKSVELHCKYSCQISIALYDLEKKMFTTDCYTFLWNTESGKQTDLNLKALFTDFAKEDIRKKYLMVTRLVHVAPIESSSATLKRHGHEQVIPQSFYCRQSFASDITEIKSIFSAGITHEAKECVLFLNRETELPLALKSYQVTNRIPKNLSNSMETKLLISSQLVPGNVAQIKERHPHLFSRSPAAILRRADRTAVSIEESRNEMYITLMQAELTGKSSDRNIEARLHVVESNGQVMENVFETVSVTGPLLSTVYKSIVVYHTDKPMWAEPIKIVLPTSASHDVYLRILFYSKKSYDKPKPEKGPFAIAHVQLIRNAGLICDGEHDLVVYKIDNPGTYFADENIAYMSLPATRRTLKESIGSSKPHATGFSLSEKSCVLISTHSCSSMLTQNEHLLNVLRWRMNCVNLTPSLIALAQPIGDTENEMIRFISHLLDALFEIWHDRETSEMIAFDVIVAILRLCEEQRHPQAAKIFESYLKRFSFTSASLKILKCLNQYVQSDSDESNEKARNAFKVMGSLFKIVVVSKKCGMKFEEYEGFEKTYKQYLREFMKSLVMLMSEKKVKMTVQNTALKSIPTIIDLLYESDSCSSENLCSFIVDLMNNFGSNIVTRERLGFIAQVVETRFFSFHGKTTANSMARSLVAVGKDRDCREERITWRKTKRRLKKLRSQLPASSISHAEVKLVIVKGKPSKALGPDGICHLHLKHVPDNCISLMAELFNASIDENKVPDSWKKANVFMLPKPGKDPTEIKSFRPVSLLSHVAKVLESIILERIRQEIESPKDQHAFKKNHSTTTAITEATNCIVGGLNMKKPACRTIMTCLDMNAAFDTISISKLLCGLEEAIADKNGAVLSPNLFNFFIRDVPTIPDTRIITYADDMTLLVQDPLLTISKAAEKSKDALDSLQKWFKDKHLDICAGKSTVTIFSADTKEFKYDPGLKWEGSAIPMQNRIRLIGVELDTMLKMNGHMEQVSARLAKANNILRALAGAKWGSSKKTMLRTFKAIIKPLATYAGPAWHQLMSETQKTKLERQYTAGLPRNEDAAVERGADTGEHTSFVKSYLSNHCTHPILGKQPPPLREEESTLPRNTRVELARLRAERSLLLEKYKAKVENRPVESCIKCSDDVGDLNYFLKCYPAKPLPMSKLWKDSVAAATSLCLALPVCRDQLLSPCLQIALDIVQLDNAATEKGEFADRAAECASIIAAILERLFADAKSGGDSGERELTAFILMVYRPLVQAMIRVIHDDKHTDDDARGHFFSVILALLDKMSAQMFSEYVEQRPLDTDKRDFLMEMVQMIRDLLNRNAFPPTWRDMIMLQNKVIHKSLRFVMSAVQTFFSNDKFCPEMWREYMVTVVSFVTQEGLNSKHEWMKSEDEDVRIQLRKAAAKDLRSMWFRLSPSQKLIYIPSMIGSFLKVSLVDDDETREATIPIFFDMMQTEYNTSSSRSFNEFASELVSQLDTLVDQHSATKGFKEHFRHLSITLCQSDKDLMENGGKELIERIDRLLTALIEYHEVSSKSTVECADSLMSRTLQLMKYYDQYNHEELYVKYIYKLYDLHTSYGNEIEAAKTLLRHATMLNFEDIPLPSWLTARSLNRHCSTQRQLKENLMQEAGNLFSKGEDWEDALIVFNQLVPVYQTILVDYCKLSELLQKISKLYTSIDRTERAFFYYYLVAFYGQGFPSYLNGHKFVFHSDKLEMHGDFMQRIMKMYDNPNKIMTTDACPHLVDSPGRHIQVFNIEPIGMACNFEENPTVNPAIKKYHRNYNIQTFEYSKIEDRKETKWTSIDCKSEFMRNWLVRRRIKTECSLPTDLRFSEVVNVSKPIYLSPLQNAVEQMRKKNKELNELAINVVYNPTFDLKLLSRDILGVVNAAVMGGVKNYQVFFTQECRAICDREEIAFICELNSLIIDQVEILEYCCYVHASRCVEVNERTINETLADAFDRHRKYVDDSFGKTSSRLPPNASIRLSSFPEDGSISDISGMATMKSTRALAIGNALGSLISSNKKTSGSSTSVSLLNRSAPSFDSLAPALRSSFSVSKTSSQSKLASTPLSPSTLVPSPGFEGIRLRPHLPRQSSTIALHHNFMAPPLPPRDDQDPSRTLKRKP